MDQYVSKSNSQVPKRILGALFSSVSAGVVPRAGAPYIAIGRNEEINAIASDLKRVSEGEGAMRFLIGRYGSGKSFLIQLVRGYACENGFVCADADLSPERKLAGCDRSGLATYRELMKNLACKASPDGGALPVILAKWFSNLSSSLAREGITPEDGQFEAKMEQKIYEVARKLEAGVGGFDFATVLCAYYKAYRDGNDEKSSACLRWFRGEWNTRTEAREAIGIRSLSIVSDDSWYNYIKLFAQFVRLVGYEGLCMFIDEGVNLFKITNRISRESNYEKILSMFNDTLQGNAEGLFILMGGTPQFLEDPRRGLFSYEALKSRLSDGRFAEDGAYKSLMSPVIRLRRLSDSEMLALLLRLTRLHADYYGVEVKISEEERELFLQDSLQRAGANQMITPREIIRDYVTLMNLLLQNPDLKCGDLIKTRMEQPVPSEPETQPTQDVTEIKFDF